MPTILKLKSAIRDYLSSYSLNMKHSKNTKYKRVAHCYRNAAIHNLNEIIFLSTDILKFLAEKNVRNDEMEGDLDYQRRKAIIKLGCRAWATANTLARLENPPRHSFNLSFLPEYWNTIESETRRWWPKVSQPKQLTLGFLTRVEDTNSLLLDFCQRARSTKSYYTNEIPNFIKQFSVYAKLCQTNLKEQRHDKNHAILLCQLIRKFKDAENTVCRFRDVQTNDKYLSDVKIDVRNYLIALLSYDTQLQYLEDDAYELCLDEMSSYMESVREYFDDDHVNDSDKFELACYRWFVANLTSANKETKQSIAVEIKIHAAQIEMADSPELDMILLETRWFSIDSDIINPSCNKTQWGAIKINLAEEIKDFKEKTDKRIKVHGLIIKFSDYFITTLNQAETHLLSSSSSSSSLPQTSLEDYVSIQQHGDGLENTYMNMPNTSGGGAGKPSQLTIVAANSLVELSSLGKRKPPRFAANVSTDTLDDDDAHFNHNDKRQRR